MLYEKWRQVVAAYADEWALVDGLNRRRWTFRELDAEASSAEVEESLIAFPQGVSAEFILVVLRAWKAGKVVCPLESGQAVPRIPTPLPPGVVHLKMTSASTGVARLVAFTAPQLAADPENIVRTMGLRREWPNLGVISLAHSYGFSSLVLPLLLHGIPLVLVGSALPEAVRRAAEQVEALTLPSVPALWRAWLDADALPRNTRLAVSAGAPLPLALEQEVFERVGVKIHNFYGSSECGGMAYDASSEPRSDGAYVGTPVREVGVSVNEDGCIEIRSRAVAYGYWPDPDPNVADGVFRTSDLGEILDGRVFLRGRAGDRINVAGRKLAPEVVERAMSQHPQVRECLVFGVPLADHERGEAIVACVSTADGATAESLRQYALSHLASWQVPRQWWLVDSIEANHRGKLSRAEWRRRFLERNL